MGIPTRLALVATLAVTTLPLPVRAASMRWRTLRALDAAATPVPGNTFATGLDAGPKLVSPWAGVLLDRDGAPLDLEKLSAPERRAALEGARMAGEMIGAAVTNATLQAGARAAPAKLVAKAVENLGELEKVVEPRRLHVGEGRIELPTGFSDRYLEPSAAVISLTQVTVALNAAFTICQTMSALRPDGGSDADESRRLADCTRTTLEEMVARYGDALRAHAPSRPLPDGPPSRSSPARPPDDGRTQRSQTVITLDL